MDKLKYWSFIPPNVDGMIKKTSLEEEKRNWQNICSSSRLQKPEVEKLRKVFQTKINDDLTNTQR